MDAALGSLGLLAAHIIAWVLVYARRPFVVEREDESTKGQAAMVVRTDDGESGRAKIE